MVIGKDYFESLGKSLGQLVGGSPKMNQKFSYCSRNCGDYIQYLVTKLQCDTS